MNIDTTGFELAMPTQVEMLEHQSLILCSEKISYAATWPRRSAI